MSSLSTLLQCKNCGSSSSFHEPLKPLVSPVPTSLGTNARPTNAEVADIRRVLLDTEADLLAYDRDIDLLEVVLESRRRERQALEEFRNLHASLLSPIRRLPPELLMEIFMLLPTDWGSQARDWDATFILGAVCSGWRKLALSMPLLWCSIYVGLKKHRSKSRADRVRTWVERSGRCPLSFRLEYFGVFHNHPVIDIVIQHSHRLQHLEVTAPPSAMKILAPLKGRLPMLQSLLLRDPIYEPESSPCDIFADAPELRILKIQWGYSLDSFDLPFGQIVHFSTETFATHECLDVLRMTPNLLACEFDDMSDNVISNYTATPVVSHLHSLSIWKSYGEQLDLGQLFGFLTLPSIRELSLHLRHPYDWPQTQFLSFISRSSCRLVKLVLRQVSMSNEDLTCILAAMPSLCELEIGVEDKHDIDGTDTMSPVDDAMLQKLTYQSGELPLAPSLHTIHFWGDHDFEDRILLNMVKSRFGGTLPEGLKRLRTVLVNLTRDFAEQTIARVGEWKEQGLDMSLKTSFSFE
jgi:hypothetical protein